MKVGHADHDADYARRVGMRLRQMRAQRDLTLLEVEAASDGEIKASVLGAYERGERVVSITRLRRVAEFYGAPVSQLLPADPDLHDEPRNDGRLLIDLRKLKSGEEEEVLVRRYLEGLQLKRGDYNGTVLTVRGEDRWVLACILGCTDRELPIRLSERGLAYESAGAGKRSSIPGNKRSTLSATGSRSRLASTSRTQ